jgi:hypothetical protein
MKCPKCGKVCRIGVNAIKGGCDKCEGITRDKEGHFWLPSEKRHEYLDTETGKTFSVTRAEAFA